MIAAIDSGHALKYGPVHRCEFNAAFQRPLTTRVAADVVVQKSETLAIGAPDHVHQLGDLAALVGLVAGLDGVLDAMGDMVTKDFLLDAA